MQNAFFAGMPVQTKTGHPCAGFPVFNWILLAAWNRFLLIYLNKRCILFITGFRENMDLKAFIKNTFRNICFIIRRKKEPVFRFLFINVPAGFSIYSWTGTSVPLFRRIMRFSAYFRILLYEKYIPESLSLHCILLLPV